MIDQLERVRALLAKAERTDNPHEAEAFTAKATKLMARHGIDAALAYQKNTATDQRADKIVTFKAPNAKAQGYLYAKVMGAMRCRVILKDDYKALHVFGFRSDMDLAEVMHSSLAVQAQRGLARARLEGKIRPANYAGADIRSFYYEFAGQVAGRLRAIFAEQAAQATSEGTGAELVLADRVQLVNAAVAAVYPRLTSKRMTYSGRAGAAGAAAGRAADLGLGGSTVSARGRRAIA